MKIGDKKVLYQETILVPDNIEASFFVSIGTLGPVNFAIRFNPEAEKTQVGWGIEQGTIRINFDKWVNPLGTALAKPQKLGSFPGVGDLFFYVFHHRVGAANRMDFQLLTEEAK